jgi:MFS-type transporter involved in bile tolerance (Atg22 family)
LFSLLSIPATLAAAFVLIRLPALFVLLAISPLWLIAAGLLAFGTGWYAGLAVATCLGLVVGPTNATARAIIAHSIAEHEAGEMFGFAAFVNRLTASLGPLFFGVLSSASSSRLVPVAVAGTVIIIGLLVLPRQARHGQSMPDTGTGPSPA